MCGVRGTPAAAGPARAALTISSMDTGQMKEGGTALPWMDLSADGLCARGMPQCMPQWAPFRPPAAQSLRWPHISQPYAPPTAVEAAKRGGRPSKQRLRHVATGARMPRPPAPAPASRPPPAHSAAGRPGCGAGSASMLGEGGSVLESCLAAGLLSRSSELLALLLPSSPLI